ncbi:LysM peptidoglycan-binding domain-containing protein [Mycobacterium sp. pV006]|uniref:LysM peptidoglycan-binding domain-containing protein n=1 Tax=Mycobacterium sp. pV006 TaxID=3238983 RepID=UPI00351B8F12
MTVIYTPETWGEITEAGWERGTRTRRARPARVPATTAPSGSRRPAVAPIRHRGTGVAVSRAPHRRRPITPATTVMLALVAAAITVWLGLVAQVGGVQGAQAAVPTQLAVVQVQAGESLQHVARRVAPEAPVADVVAKIRELNQLETVALNAGQTLIAPVA